MIKHFKELVKYRELIFSLTQREIKVRYKQSILGIAWAILQPLLMMLVFTIIFSKFLKIPSDGIPYPIFSYCALLPWTFLATSLSFAIPSIQTHAGLITKIYFPREIFPISCILAAFVDYLIAFVLFLGMMFFYKVPFAPSLLFVFILLLVQIILTLGVSLLASAINTYYRDVRYALPLFIQLWLYASPIIYPVSMVPQQFRTLYMLNPMAGLIDGYRNIFIKGIPPDFYYLGLAAMVAVVLFSFSYFYFKRLELTFADVV